MMTNLVFIMCFVLVLGAAALVVARQTKHLQDKTNEISNLKKTIQRRDADMVRLKEEAEKEESRLRVDINERGVKQSALLIKIRAILASLEMDAVAKAALDVLQKFGSARRGAIYWATPDSSLLRVLASIGRTPQDDGIALNYSTDKGFIGYVAKEKIPLLRNDVKTEQALRGLLGKSQIPTILTAPLVDRKSGRLIGILNIEELFRTEYTAEERSLFLLTTSVTELGIQNAMVLFQTHERALESEAQKEEIKNIASRYVNRELMEEILNDPTKGDLSVRRTELTILAIDIRGFTKFSETFSPELIVEILNDYFSVMTEIITMHGGYLDKFIGDAIMALFGMTGGRDVHAELAVRCALDMRDAATEFQERWQQEKGAEWAFNVGIGLNTGPCVVGNIGSSIKMDHTAIGDAVNTTFRLESIAPPGHIYLSDSTYEKVSHLIDVRSLDLIKVKGKEQPVQVYDLIGPKNAGDSLFGFSPVAVLAGSEPAEESTETELETPGTTDDAREAETPPAESGTGEAEGEAEGEENIFGGIDISELAKDAEKDK